MMVFAITLLLPVLMFVAVLLDRLRTTEDAQYAAQIAQVAERAVSAMDRQFENSITVASTLAASGALETGDLAAFHRHASAITRNWHAALVLRAEDGTQLLNTRVPYGRKLPISTPRLEIGRVLDSGRPSVSDSYIGAVSRVRSISITVPVTTNQAQRFVLSAVIRPEALTPLLREQQPGPGWSLAIRDGAGVLLAQVGPAGGADAPDRTGLVVSRPSALSRWSLTVAAPASRGAAGVDRARVLLAWLGGATLLAALAIATLFGRAIARPLRAIALASDALVHDRVFTPPPTRTREIRALGETLQAASALLHHRAAERDEFETRLRALNEGLEDKIRQRTLALSNANMELKAESTQRAAAETQLRHLQKMEALGQLTGGIAHDFNNMLAVVIGSLNLAERRLAASPSDALRFIRGAHEGAIHASALTARLLAFSRRQTLEPSPVHVNDLIARLLEMLGRTLGERLQVRLNLDDDLWGCFIDAAQLESALLNLALNARDAMPDGGMLTIETANAALDADYARRSAEPVQVGDYVMIAVADTGVGMSASVVERAFEPFFTTKSVGNGTGLGLSQVHGFIRQSLGHLNIHSEPGIGTTIRIYLPRFDLANPAAAGPQGDEAIDADDGRTILVVEDDPRVRAMSVSALEELGYRVLEADSAERALDMLATDIAVDLLFTDVVMPHMNGRELAEAAHLHRPDMPVLYTSGYTRNAIIHNGVLDPGLSMLHKPFTLAQLSARVRAMLR